MKLLIVTPYFYPKMGGLENYAYNLSIGLKKRYKWNVIVITSNHKNRTDIVETIGGIKIYRLGRLFKLSNTPINPFWYWKIKKIIANEKPDIINGHAPVPFIADIASRTSGKIPFVLTYHAGSMKKGKVFFDFIIGIYEKLFLSGMFKRANKIICASQFVKDTIVNPYSRKSVVITPAVDINKFKPSRKKKEKSVLFVGRYANVYPLKGLPYLLNAMRELPNVKLTIIGEKFNIKQKNVRFLGVKSGQDIVREMQKNAILVLPSIAPMESFGMVLIEAMACKTPVIGTRMGGIPEIIKNKKNGLLVPIKNTDALTNAIKTIINDDLLAKRLGEQGLRDVYKSYVWNTKVNQTYNTINNILK